MRDKGVTMPITKQQKHHKKMNVKPNIEGYYTTDQVAKITEKSVFWVYKRISAKKRRFNVSLVSGYYYIEKSSFDEWWNDGNPKEQKRMTRLHRRKNENGTRSCEYFYGCDKKIIKRGLRRCPEGCECFRKHESEHFKATPIYDAVPLYVERRTPLEDYLKQNEIRLRPYEEICTTSVSRSGC